MKVSEAIYRAKNCRANYGGDWRVVLVKHKDREVLYIQPDEGELAGEILYSTEQDKPVVIDTHRVGEDDV